MIPNECRSKEFEWYMTDYNGEFTRKTTRSYAQQQLILSVTKVKTQQEMLIKKQDNQKNKQK